MVYIKSNSITQIGMLLIPIAILILLHCATSTPSSNSSNTDDPIPKQEGWTGSLSEIQLQVKQFIADQDSPLFSDGFINWTLMLSENTKVLRIMRVGDSPIDKEEITKMTRAVTSAANTAFYIYEDRFPITYIHTDNPDEIHVDAQQIGKLTRAANIPLLIAQIQTYDLSTLEKGSEKYQTYSQANDKVLEYAQIIPENRIIQTMGDTFLLSLEKLHIPERFKDIELNVVKPKVGVMNPNKSDSE